MPQPNEEPKSLIADPLATAGGNFFPESFGKKQTLSNSGHCSALSKPPVMSCSVMIMSIRGAKLVFILSALPTHLSCKVIPFGGFGVPPWTELAELSTMDNNASG